MPSKTMEPKNKHDSRKKWLFLINSTELPPKYNFQKWDGSGNEEVEKRKSSEQHIVDTSNDCYSLVLYVLDKWFSNSLAPGPTF